MNQVIEFAIYSIILDQKANIYFILIININKLK